MLYRKKSYHSMVVPMVLATTARRRCVRCSRSSIGSDCCLAESTCLVESTIRASSCSRVLARRRPLLAITFAPQAGHGRAERDRLAAVAADAIAGQADIQR